ncbi:DUF6338 family protein [Glycomyces sp. NPDC048151]|uniref:DUF6338 family protein n=1 Tax=Glycomyces sp. NPDC048151 TaxID=3364002 RepID=UPI003713EA2B
MNDFLSSAAAAIVSGLAITVLFTVPGYLLHTAYSRGMRTPEAQDRVFLARTVVGSLIVQALALPWTVHLLEQARAGVASPWNMAAWALVVLVAAPVVAGSLAAAVVRLRRPHWFAAVLDFTGLAHHVRVPDAWQWHFSDRQPYYVRVHLKDQRIVLGYLGSRSFAASGSPNRDLYLERQYAPGEGKVYGPAVPGSGGVWINGDEIAFVEFHGGASRTAKAVRKDSDHD